MAKRKKRRAGAVILIILIILILLFAAAAAAYFIMKPKADPASALDSLLSSVSAETPSGLSGADALIAEAAKSQFKIEADGQITQSYRNAAGNIIITQFDEQALGADIAAEMQELMAQFVAEASRPSEIYSDDGSFLPELTEKAYTEIITGRLEHAENYRTSYELPVTLNYSKDQWQLDGMDKLLSAAKLSPASMPGYEEAVSALEYIDFHYRLDDWTSPGPVPDSGCYGETDDPQVILDLLETETAKKLINGQSLDFNPDDLLPGRSIHYYLDETILALVWQEDEHGAVGTFAETFIADASQLRRKIVNDTFRALTYCFPTDLSEQANAVVAVSGDFYDHPDRIFGIYAYDGQVMLTSLTKGQTCFFTDEGDMLFTYENQFATDEEAQKFMDENRAMFSVSFGPVMVENGVDVTPYDYPLGEVLDTYARCAFGQLGHLHYLAMTINCEEPDHYVYVTLRQAADSMIAHGCINAYTLDGGQTGSIIIGNQLINPVQFGREREMSDIIYFATAIPND